MYYIMSPDGTPVRTDIHGWARWMKMHNNCIRKTDVGPMCISTVFLGIDHSFGEGPLILFETMVFPGEQQFRHKTYGEALATHEVIVKTLRKELEALN